MPTNKPKPLSEKRKGLHRIATNYGRLIATMAMGIAMVPLQFNWLGMEGFGLLGLIGSSVAIGSMLQDMMRSSMVRELGAAWHERENGKFRESYAASFRVSAIVALLTGIFFAIIIAVLPFFKIREEWIEPAQWIAGCEGVSTCFIVLLSPTINMLIVREQFFWHNVWTVVRRSAFLIATIIPYLIMHVTDIPKGLILYGTILLIVNITSTVFLVGGFLIADKRLVPTARGSTPEAMKKVAGTFGWNSSVVLAINLQETVASFIMNFFFGLWGNAVFSLALRLVSYIRMATLGLTFGLDSVSARLSSAEDKSSLQSMFRHSSRMLGFVAFPAMIVVFVLAEPLLRMWVGRSVSNPSELLPASELLVKIMVLGLTCRAISDGWMKLFYGAGHIRKYAPYVLAGGFVNPLLSIGFILLLPKSWDFTGAAVAYSLVFLIVHMIIMPKVTAKQVGLTFNTIVSPIFRPLIVAFVSFPILFVGYLFTSTQTLDWTGVIVGVGSYALLYGIASWWFILTKQERNGIKRLYSRVTDRSLPSS